MSPLTSGTWCLQTAGKLLELGGSVPAPCPPPCHAALGCPSDLSEPQPLAIHKDPRAPLSPPGLLVFSKDSSVVLLGFRPLWTTLGLTRVTLTFDSSQEHGHHVPD